MPSARIVFRHLGEAVRQAHPKGGMQTASFCACGWGSGGPIGSDACNDLKRLEEFMQWLDVDVARCPEEGCQNWILPNERYTNLMTKETWEESGRKCPDCRANAAHQARLAAMPTCSSCGKKVPQYIKGTTTCFHCYHKR